MAKVVRLLWLWLHNWLRDIWQSQYDELRDIESKARDDAKIMQKTTHR